MIRTIMRTAIGVYLLSPFLILILKLDNWSLPPREELTRALIFTSEQAFLSALGTLILGFLGGRALLSWPQRNKIVDLFLLAPGILPTIFIILACFKVFSPFPFGLWGIVIIHVFMNTGLVSVSFARLFETKISGWAELALVEGAKPLKFFWISLLYLKKDILLLFLFIFCLCFASLTVPLVAGKFDSLTTETLIYEKIKISGEWGQALGLSLLQSLIILSFTVFLSSDQPIWSHRKRNLTLLASKWGIVFPLIFSLITFGSLLDGAAVGWSQITANSHLQTALVKSLGGTFIVGIGVAFLTLLLFLQITYVTPHQYFRKFLVGYLTPSSVLTGFSILLLDLNIHSLAKMILGITLIQLPIFYRLHLDGALGSLENQVAVARTLGANWSQIFYRITVPQVFGVVGFAAGLSGLWACGEFALSSLLSGQDLTVALLLKSSLASYRLEVATLLAWFALFSGGIVWLAFWGLGYVVDRKSLS